MMWKFSKTNFPFSSLSWEKVEDEEFKEECPSSSCFYSFKTKFFWEDNLE